MSTGIVFLVGAGPGDPGLITVRGAELLRTAEVVAHDELISPALLAMVPPSAERLRVGRRHGDGERAFALHPDVLARARAGLRVVRLKAGDPLVFGRGAEEAEALRAAGIPFEIVPGITAALGAAACAGIPLTDRRHASCVTLTTGHAAAEPVLGPDGGCQATLAIYMGGQNLAANLARLIAEGRSPETPAAFVSCATRPDQQVITGSLRTLPALVDGLQASGPALVIIGEVVRLRSKIAWLPDGLSGPGPGYEQLDEAHEHGG